MPDQDVNQPADPSSAENTSGVTPADPPSAPGVNAESPPADSGRTLFDVLGEHFGDEDPDLFDPNDEPDEDVEQEAPAASEGDGEEAPVPETQGGDTPGQETQPEQLPEEISEAELAAYTPKANERIRQLVAQRNEVREQLEQVAPLLDFAKEHSLPQEAVGLGLNLMAALHYGDYDTFLRGIAPHVHRAQQAMGLSLPEDLQREVEQGYVTKTRAQEEARLRAEVAERKRQHELDRQRSTQQQEAQRVATVRNAVSEWEGQQRATDPDYAIKERLIQRHASDLIREHGLPGTTEQAIEVANRAKALAEQELEGYRPRTAPPRPTRPSASSTMSTSAPQAARPKSLQDAVNLGLRRAAQNR